MIINPNYRIMKRVKYRLLEQEIICYECCIDCFSPVMILKIVTFKKRVLLPSYKRRPRTSHNIFSLFFITALKSEVLITTEVSYDNIIISEYGESNHRRPDDSDFAK